MARIRIKTISILARNLNPGLSYGAHTLDLKCSFTLSYLSKYSGLCKALNCSFVATGQFFKSQDLRDLFLSFVFFVLSSFMGVRAQNHATMGENPF